MRDPLRRCPHFVLCFLLAACGTQLLAQAGGAIKVIKVDSKDAGPVSSAGVLVNRTLYIAGQDGRNPMAVFQRIFSRRCASRCTMCKVCCARQEWTSAMPCG